MTAIHWTPVIIIRPRRAWGRPAPPNGHIAQVLHADHWGLWPYNWDCSCGVHGQPEHTRRATRHQAQNHVNHPERP